MPTSRRNLILLPFVFGALDALAMAGCKSGKDASDRASVGVTSQASSPSANLADDELNPRLLRRFQPLDLPTATASKARIDLGRQLFFETRLSRSGTTSCDSCHALDAYGVDHERFSRGATGAIATRNTPTVYNASGQFVQFWDGRALDVEAQAKGPILNVVEMAMPDEGSVVSVLAKIPGYVAAFASAFPESDKPITWDNVGVAIGAFERGLVTPGRWDAFLRGDRHALSVEERRGLHTFINVGCMVCHTGAYVGGSMFERVGVVEPWPNQVDEGRFGVTHTPADRMTFKVPSLRNVEKTAPYFHDGFAVTLDEAVKKMGRHQLGLELSKEETVSIVTWLKALTGPLPAAEYIAKPELPQGS